MDTLRCVRECSGPELSWLDAIYLRLLLTAAFPLLQETIESSSTLITCISIYILRLLRRCLRILDASSSSLSSLNSLTYIQPFDLPKRLHSSDLPQCISLLSPPLSTWPAQSQPLPATIRMVSGSNSVIIPHWPPWSIYPPASPCLLYPTCPLFPRPSPAETTPRRKAPSQN